MGNFGFDITDIYNIPTMSIDSPFLRWQYEVLTEALKDNKIPAFILDNVMSKAGYNSNKPVLENGVINLCVAGGLANENRTLADDMAEYRYKLYGGTEPLSKISKQVLIIDYLLNSCICYIEVYKGTTPQKFYATRNLKLLKVLSTVNPDDPALGKFAFPLTKNLNDSKLYAKANMAVAPLSFEDIKLGFFKFLKLEKRKAGYSLSIPTAGVSLMNSSVRITPLFYMYAFTDNLLKKLRSDIYNITFLKDNLTERSMITTLNKDLLIKVYEGDVDRADNVIRQFSKETLTRGYLMLPELLLPLSDDSGTRAMSLRYRGMYKVDAAKFQNPYLHIDLDAVPTQFMFYIQRFANNVDVLRAIYNAIESSFGRSAAPVYSETERDLKAEHVTRFKDTLDAMTANSIILAIQSWLDSQLLVSSTSTKRIVHDFMLSNPMFFTGYTGRTISAQRIVDLTNSD